MARKRAPTKATGGGGYTFADKVAAALLAQMLKRVAPLDPAFGSIAELHFETGESGQLLDDLRLVLRRGNDRTRCAVSVKSGAQLRTRGFSKEFVGDAWEQTRGASFDSTSDLLVLVVGAVSEQALQGWRVIEAQAADTTAERLAARLASSQSSAVQRRIFESLRGTSKTDKRNAVDTVRLASRIRVMHFSDERESAAISLCAEIVQDGTETEGAKLWDRLQKLASDNRGTGGFFHILKLLRALRPDFQLRNYPDFEADWSRLDSFTRYNLKAVRAVIGTDARIARDDVMSKLAETIAATTVVAVVGESGSGKSAAIAQFVAEPTRFKRVLWLTAEHLSRSSHTEVALALGLRHSIPDLISHSTIKECVLVLDGFEQFQGAAHRRAIDLLEALRTEQFAGWKVIVTCQTRFWESVQDALIAVGITDLRRMDFVVPLLEQVLAAVRDQPALRTLLLRHDLQPVLRNLVVLDWVVRANIADRFSCRAWVGETEVIGYVWERWMGDGPQRFAREFLLRTLAEREGEHLSGAAHRDTIPPEQLPLLGELADEGLLRVSDPSVRFSHDLLGDWGRFRALVFAGAEAVQRIKVLAPIPRWGRAIRLYAQSLAEQGAGLTSWKSVSAQLAGDDPGAQLTQDLFLDGLLFASNSEALLEQVWEDLIGDGGQILRRLLTRLLHVASLPDWRAALIRESRNIDRLAAWFRIPLPLYWYPALCVFSRHADDVAKNALLDAAEVCTLWLRTMPPGVAGRHEAGTLALALGRETQALLAEGAHFTDKTPQVFEAFLQAAPEFTNGVAQMALEVAERRPEPQHAVQRRVEWNQKQAALQAEWRKRNPTPRKPSPPVFALPSGGTMRAPAADGPLRRVPDGFQAAVLDTTGLHTLIAARPEAAREVLLAVCIEEPRRFDPYNDRTFLLGRCGLEHWRSGYPAIYWKGPFLHFLRTRPREGLDGIVRLVNYATGRWLEAAAGPGASEDRLRQFGLEFTFGDRTVTWSGDANVFGWHRVSSLHASTVALMALEKWLYEELDGKRDIAEWIRFIYEHGRSLAFAGVLVSLGMRHPRLFTADLLPLLGNFYVFRIQLNWVLHEQDESWRLGLADHGEEFVRLAVEWHRLPHRRYVLQRLAQQLMQHEGTQRYLSARRAAWSALLEQPGVDRETIEIFLAPFDPTNYTTTTQPDGGVSIELTLPAHLASKMEDSQQESSIKLLSLGLAGRARSLLRDQDVLNPSDLAGFAEDIQCLANWQPTNLDRAEQQYRNNSIAGGIAVLIIKHRRWLSEHSDVERWCFETVQMLTAIVDGDHDSPMSLMDHNAEAFLGEIGVALLAERIDEWVLRLAFNGVTGFYYSSTWHTMWVACDFRATLGERFDELINIVAFWSGLRRAAMRETRHLDDRTVLNRYRETLYRRYAVGRLRRPLTSLKAVDTLGRRLVQRIDRRSMSAAERRSIEARRAWAAERPTDRKYPREIPDIDLEVLKRGFGFLPAMMRKPSPDDVARVNDYVKELFELEMRTFASIETAGDDGEVDGTPYEFDGWVMQQIAEFIAHVRSVETARRYYQPILALGPAARYWVDDFLHAWIRTGLTVTSDRVMCAAIWQDMVDFVLALPRWRPRMPGYWSPAESLAADLMGLDKDSATVLGQNRFKDVVVAMMPAFERWAAAWLTHASPAAGFAHFLVTESGTTLLRPGIKQLARVVGCFRNDDWHRQELGLLFTEALANCWKHLRQEVEHEEELRSAFLTILTELCARQVPEALHLRDRVSTVLGSS